LNFTEVYKRLKESLTSSSKAFQSFIFKKCSREEFRSRSRQKVALAPNLLK
jgi:hypothetical protein